ncbi:MAG: hypothetical protein AAF318_09075 [Pseudomonadota bacterium]
MDTLGIKPPLALRPKEPLTVEQSARLMARRAGEASRDIPKRYLPPVKPLVVGAAAALVVSFVLDIGPWSSLTGKLLGTAGAQEVTGRATPANTGNLAVPSEADRAALRYFAREGDVDRLEAELRRLRALYPNWQPPRDLLDQQGEDTELQRVYDLVGNQQYDEARAALAERRQRDPAYEPPARLIDLLELAEIREQLREASEANNHALVLNIAQQNERILTCQDVDSIWRVAEAFAETGRAQRAYDAYAYVIQSCEGQGERASSLQKAAETLDPALVTQLFALGAAEDGTNEFASARLEIIRGAVARGGTQEGVPVPLEWLQLLGDFARTGENLEDAMLVGFYLYRQGNPSEAAAWFRFALDSGLGSDAAEAYIVALRATGDREDEFLAREVAFQWREQTPELMEAYLDAMSTILTADELGQTSIEDVEQTSVDRFVPIVIQQRDPNGAQALGWYAFNTCQFIIAEEWFISSANWVPTEAAMYGLALTRLRLGDQAGFDEIVDEWGTLYRSVNALRTGEDLDPADPVTGDRDDPTDEVGVESVICDPEERERLRELIRQNQNPQDPVIFTEAGSLTAAPIRVNALARRPVGMQRPDIPRRSVVIEPRDVAPSLLHQIQATAPERRLIPAPATTAAPGQVVEPPPITSADRAGGQESVVRQRALGTEARFRDTRAETTVRRRRLRLRDGQPVRPVQRRTTVVSGANRPLQTAGSTVTRRVRQGATTSATTTTPEAGVDAAVRQIVNRPRRTSRRRSTRSSSRGTGASSAQQALASKNFSRCIAVTDRAIRRGNLSAEDATARGFCLLELRRPIEAAQAFQLARMRARFGSSAASDAVYGATLAAISSNLTNEAAITAASAPMSRPRRTEVSINILTQRAIAANRANQPVQALYYLDQRNRIAPMQKDLMLLQGFAYRDAGNFKAADRIFRAVNRAGPTKDTRRAVFLANERRFPSATRSTIGNGFR